jgi:hypothetical protein
MLLTPRFLKSRLEKFLRFFQRPRSSPSSYFPCLLDQNSKAFIEFPRRDPVRHYLLILKHTILYAEDPLEELGKYQVAAVYHYRDIFSQRQSVYAELKVVGEPDTSTRRFFRFERTQCRHTTLEDLKALQEEEEKGAKADSSASWLNVEALKCHLARISAALVGQNDMSLSVDSLSLSSKSSLASSLEHNPDAIAEDLVTWVQDLPSAVDHEVISKYVASGHPLSLLQLSLMATVVGLQDPMYTLLKRQRYWYAAILVALVSCEPGYILDPSVATTATSTKEDVEHDDVCLHKYHPNLAGQWKVINVSQVKEGMVSEIRSQYDADWRSIEGEVSSGCYH